MKALSLFNGISALHLALDKAEIEVDQVYYAEIDKYANKITEQHYPDDVALGDVTKWREWSIDWGGIDLVGAGFPCQAWSVAGKQLGDKDERGMLFWTTLEIIAHVLKHNPKAKFLMENVKMKKDFEQYITHHTEQALGHVEKTLINSALVSAQNRQRYYWTNFEVTQPDDKGILLKDIIEGEPDVKFNLSNQRIQTIKKSRTGGVFIDPSKKDKIGTLIASYHKIPSDGNYIVCGGARDNVVVYGEPLYPEATAENKKNEAAFIEFSGMNETVMKTGKTYCLTANYGGAWAKHSATKKVRTMAAVGFTQDSDVMTSHNQIKYRKLTPLECERLQTFPEIKKSAIIEFSEKHGKIEWLLEHQRTNVSVGAKYRKLQSSALSAEEKELNQCASAAMSCLSISQADQEMPVQKNVHIILGEGQLQLNYQGKPLLSVNVAELLKKQVHPALEVDIAQEIAGINSILGKILHNGKGELPVSLKSSMHQESGSSNAGRYGQEIELGVKDAKLSAVQDLMDTYTILDHGQNLKTLDLNLQTLFYSVSSVIDLFTLEKIQKGSLLKISIEYSCGFTSMISNTQRYKSLGNAWTVDVIVHILKCAFN